MTLGTGALTAGFFIMKLSRFPTIFRFSVAGVAGAGRLLLDSARGGGAVLFRN